MNLLQRDEAYRALRQSQQQLLEANLELRRLTHSDGLTGLSNRRYLDEYLAAEWRRGARERSELSLLMIDVDNFKLYNDTYGHVSGDGVLRQVAATIERCLAQSGDFAARFGGEEFAVVMPATTPGAARLLGGEDPPRGGGVAAGAHAFVDGTLRDDQHRRREHRARAGRAGHLADRSGRSRAVSREARRQESRRRGCATHAGTAGAVGPRQRSGPLAYAVTRRRA
jgi:GGDEF domain-containing protein